MKLSLAAFLLFAAGCSATPDDGASEDSTATTAATAQSTAATATDATVTPTGDASDGTGGTGGQGGSHSGTVDPGATDSDSGSQGCPATTNLPVVLGGPDDLATAGAYAILAKTAVTNVTGSSLTGGHLGLSPASASFITGFSLSPDPGGVYSTSASVVAPGKVYAADYTVPTPVLLTTAVLGMQAAYVDAASRMPTDHLDLNSGDLGGLTLTPGIYTWGTTVEIPADVTISGCADDVWVFQISGDLDLGTSRRVLLAGGARAEHIFWQVAGQATLHADAHLEGILLSRTAITLQTGASLHGRALAQTMVALDDNVVTVP